MSYQGEKLFKIGEVMHYSGLSRQTVHNYTLAGLIIEAHRTDSGHRLYPESVFDDIEKIKVLQKQNKTLREIKEILDFERKAIEQQQKQQLSIEFEED